MKQSNDTTFAPNNISYTDGTNVNEQYGIGGSLLRRETNIPGNQPNEELYRFGADGNMRLYSYDRLFYSLYGYDAGTTRTYKYSMDLSPNWVNGRLEAVNFNMHNAMFYPNSYLNFNNNGYYTKHYYNGMERIASRLGDQNLQIHTNDPELQDRKDQLDSNIRRNIVDITGYEFLPVGEEQNPDDPKPIFELPQVAMTGLQPIGGGDIYYYHGNHLGSTAFVTDQNQTIVQGFLYAPFGEITNEYNAGWQSGTLPKYSFNAKELDEETGMYYYEARYMAPPVFTSRDRLFEKYPFMSPYGYCMNNPIKYIDPSGDSVIITGDDEKMINMAMRQLARQSSNLKFTRNSTTGGISVTGEAKTEKEVYMKNIIQSNDVIVIVNVQDNPIFNYEGKIYKMTEGGGAHMGVSHIYEYDNKEQLIRTIAEATHFVNIPRFLEADGNGELLWHEIAEGFECGIITLNNGVPNNACGNNDNKVYTEAHEKVNLIFCGEVESYDYYSGGIFSRRYYYINRDKCKCIGQ